MHTQCLSLTTPSQVLRVPVWRLRSRRDDSHGSRPRLNKKPKRDQRESQRPLPSRYQQAECPEPTAELVTENTTTQMPKPFNPLNKWTAIPPRYKIMVATSVSLLLSTMDKVNLSVAIIPMARQFGWSATLSGIIQSAFFYGYALFQLPSGFFNTLFSGARMLTLGVTMFSTATVLVPMLGSNIVQLCVLRAMVGIGEAVVPGSLTDMVASIIPVTERSRCMTYVGTSYYTGSLLGLMLSPIITERFGWPFVFYSFGGAGILWTVWWVSLLQSVERAHPIVYTQLIGTQRRRSDGKKQIPWRGMFRCRPLHALAYLHFCNNWFSFTTLAWLPSFFKDTLGVGLTRAAQLSLLPPAAGILSSFAAGFMADYLTRKGLPLGRVRKTAQFVSFVGAAVCLAFVAFLPLTSHSLIFISMAHGFNSFSLAGLYCNHQDLSTTYSSLLLGITNTAGAMTGMLGVTATGALLDLTKSWILALFAPCIFFLITGFIIFAIYGSGEEVDFRNNNQLFFIEKVFRRFTDRT